MFKKLITVGSHSGNYMKELKIFGFTSKYMYLREAMRYVEKQLLTTSLTTISFIDTSLAVLSKDNMALTDILNQINLLIPEDYALLEVGGPGALSHIREINDSLYLKSFIEYFAKNKLRIFLVSDSQDSLYAIRQSLLGIDSHLTFFGSVTYSPETGLLENTINEINAAAPDIILSLLPSFQGQSLMINSRHMINARLWICLSSKTLKKAGKVSFISRLTAGINSFVSNKILKKAVTQYENSDN